MDGFKTLFCSSKLPRAREGFSSLFVDILDTRPQTVSPSLDYRI